MHKLAILIHNKQTQKDAREMRYWYRFLQLIGRRASARQTAKAAAQATKKRRGWLEED